MSMETFEVPVVLVRTGDDSVTAVAAGAPGPGWGELAGPALHSLRRLLRGDGSPVKDSASVRQFTMREEDLPFWDNLKRLGKDGYAFGTLQSEDGKFAKNVSIKEVAPLSEGVKTAQIDPTALANAAALSQIQSAIEHLTERIEELAASVEWTNDFLAGWQEGEVLAALETIVEVHRRYQATGKVGSVDWVRVVQMEQLLKSQHRRILKELGQVGRRVHFRTFEQAKKARHLDEHRVADLLALESYVLRGLAYLVELTLVAKAQEGELSLEEVQDATALIRRCMVDARTASARIADAHTRMRGRGWFEQLMTQGLIGGRIRDDAVEEDARKKRRAIREVVRPWDFDALGRVGVLALTPAASFRETSPGAEIESPA